MMNDVVKAWRDPYFREVEAVAQAVTPHPSGDISQVVLEDIVGGDDDTFLTLLCCPNTQQTTTCPSDTWQGWCETMQSNLRRCCCPDTSDPFWCI